MHTYIAIPRGDHERLFTFTGTSEGIYINLSMSSYPTFTHMRYVLCLILKVLDEKLLKIILGA